MRTAIILAWISAMILAGTGLGCSHPDLSKDAGPDADANVTEDRDRPDGDSPPADDGGSGNDGDPGSSGDDGAPDTTPPCLINAFSPGEGIITAHFSEPMDPGTAGALANYTVRGSSGDSVTLVAASVSGPYVRLQVAPGTRFVAGTDYQLLASNVTDLAGNRISSTCNRADKIRRTLYLNLIWHQHQPLYLDAMRDQLMSPWVRKHATKDYYDMAAILAQYPKVHLNVNLTSVLLTQLKTYYLDRLGPFVDIARNRVNTAEFLAAWEGHTDPWIDLLLKPTPTPATVSEVQLGLLHKDPWSCVSTSDVMMQRFPEYRALRDKARSSYTQEDFLNLKGWFEISWFDPDFLRSAVQLPNGWVVDLTDVVEERADGTFWLKQPITEDLCNRLVAENYKVMANVIPIHQRLLYPVTAGSTGQIEVLTTPFYHPILPLLHDTDEARENQPWDPLPDPPYRYPQDARDQVTKAVKFFRGIFGVDPRGMWPGEGSVAQSVVDDFVDAGLLWVATGQEVLAASTPRNQRHWFAYRAQGSTRPLAVMFRDTGLSNAIGFRYQGMTGPQAAASFMGDVLAQAPALGEPDRLLTVIMDGENAWESYAKDMDGKRFLHELYQALERAFDAGEVISVTGSEYLEGNGARNVPPHPAESLTLLTHLSAGSWIDGNFGIWVGEPEENVAWNCLLRTRQDLERSRLPRPNPLADPPTDPNSREFQIYMAWEELYAAEGSDWFWWFGQDMITPANDDTPFDRGFRAHLNGVYAFMNQALAPNTIEPYLCPVIIQESGKTPKGPFTRPPVIDGTFMPSEAEWIDEGGFYNDSDSGAVANPDDIVNRVYYGYDNQNLYLSVAANIDLRTRLNSGATPFKLEFYFNHKHITNPDTGTFVTDPAGDATRNGTPLVFKAGGKKTGAAAPGPARVLAMDFAGAQPVTRRHAADGSGGWAEQSQPPLAAQVAGPSEASAGKVVELRIPLSDLNLSFGDPLEVAVVAAQGGADIDLAPNMGTQVVFEDATNVVKVVFEVDVSGSRIARDTYGTCCTTPPPPDGSGIVYIAGNLPALGAQGDKWVPNDVSLCDDGDPLCPGDAVAGDRKWTLIVNAQRNETIKYKYTIGTPSDKNRWSGTEEFPVTYRGIVVTGDDPGRKLIRLVVHDVFADKPNGGRDGYPGSMTTFEYVYE